MFEDCVWTNYVKTGYKFVALNRSRRPSNWSSHEVTGTDTMLKGVFPSEAI